MAKPKVKAFIKKLGEYFNYNSDMRFMYALQEMIKSNPPDEAGLESIARKYHIKTGTHLKTRTDAKYSGKYDRLLEMWKKYQKLDPANNKEMMFLSYLAQHDRLAQFRDEVRYWNIQSQSDMTNTNIQQQKINFNDAIIERQDELPPTSRDRTWETAKEKAYLFDQYKVRNPHCSAFIDLCIDNPKLNVKKANEFIKLYISNANNDSKSQGEHVHRSESRASLFRHGAEDYGIGVNTFNAVWNFGQQSLAEQIKKQVTDKSKLDILREQVNTAKIDDWKDSDFKKLAIVVDAMNKMDGKNLGKFLGTDHIEEARKYRRELEGQFRKIHETRNLFVKFGFLEETPSSKRENLMKGLSELSFRTGQAISGIVFALSNVPTTFINPTENNEVQASLTQLSRIHNKLDQQQKFGASLKRLESVLRNYPKLERELTTLQTKVTPLVENAKTERAKAEALGNEAIKVEAKAAVEKLAQGAIDERSKKEMQQANESAQKAAPRQATLVDPVAQPRMSAKPLVHELGTAKAQWVNESKRLLDEVNAQVANLDKLDKEFDLTKEGTKKSDVPSKEAVDAKAHQREQKEGGYQAGKPKPKPLPKPPQKSTAMNEQPNDPNENNKNGIPTRRTR